MAELRNGYTEIYSVVHVQRLDRYVSVILSYDVNTISTLGAFNPGILTATMFLRSHSITQHFNQSPISNATTFKGPQSRG